MFLWFRPFLQTGRHCGSPSRLPSRFPRLREEGEALAGRTLPASPPYHTLPTPVRALAPLCESAERCGAQGQRAMKISAIDRMFVSPPSSHVKSQRPMRWYSETGPLGVMRRELSLMELMLLLKRPQRAPSTCRRVST